MSLRVKTILISQPEPPADARSPYADLEDKYKVQLHFKEFTVVKGATAKEFRRDKVDILEHTAIILTSRVAIEHFFRLCEEMRVDLPADMKYFCTSEAVALYLQKFITYRKRKVFYPKQREQEIFDLVQKHKNEKYFVPRSTTTNTDIQDFLKKHKIKFSEASLYFIQSNDLSDLTNLKFDIIALFTPAAMEAIKDNFPDWEQGNTRIAAFGATTCQVVTDLGYRLDIEAPTPEAPSMKMALEAYIRKVNG